MQRRLNVPDIALTVAPDIGADVVLSVTRPVIVPVCAAAMAGVAVRRIRHTKRLIELQVIGPRVDWVETGRLHPVRVFEPAVVASPRMAAAVWVLREREEGSAPERRTKIVTMT